jgi:hypothetical protein
VGLLVSGYLDGMTVAEPIVIGNKQSQQISVMGLIKRLLQAALAARVDGAIKTNRQHSSIRKYRCVMAVSFFHAWRGAPFVSTRGFASLSQPKASLVNRKRSDIGNMIKGGAQSQVSYVVLESGAKFNHL